MSPNEARYTRKVDDGQGGLRHMTRAEAIAAHGEPDKEGHIERFSDSSFYDGVCVMCGCTDRDASFRAPCPAAPPASVSQREAAVKHLSQVLDKPASEVERALTNLESRGLVTFGMVRPEVLTGACGLAADLVR